MGSIMGFFETTQEWRDALEAWDGIHDAPKKENRSRRNGFKAFESDWVEKYIGTAHWSSVGMWAIPVSASFAAAARAQGLPWRSVAKLYASGALSWSFIEYLLHRWVFHLPPSENETLKEIQFMMHGYHHEFPNDPGRLVAPPVLAWPIAGGLAVVFRALFGQRWRALYGGLIGGYLIYDWVHYYTHHGKPTSRAAKFMRRFHIEHHYKHSTSQFGLSSPLWDVFFRTFEAPTQPNEVEREYVGEEA